MRKRWILAMAIMAGLVSIGAEAAQPIEGKWRTANGETTSVAPCGGSYCILVETGKYKGKRIGRVAGSGNSYVGEVTDPTNDKTYEGSATISGSKLKLSGCVLKVFCRDQTWSRQP